MTVHSATIRCPTAGYSAKLQDVCRIPPCTTQTKFLTAAAERPGATMLYTEDLNDGQQYGSVTAINPFKEH